MLVAHLTRLTPGRPEAQLGCITIVPLRPARVGDASRYAVHLTGLDGDNLPVEGHFELPEWDGAQPPMALLRRALDVAGVVAEVQDAASGKTVIVTERMFRTIANAALSRNGLHGADREDVIEQLRMLDQGRDADPLVATSDAEVAA